jgi:hypothetical protein
LIKTLMQVIKEALTRGVTSIAFECTKPFFLELNLSHIFVGCFSRLPPSQRRLLGRL